MRVLITDAESAVSLAIARSLGKNGIECVCTSTTKIAVTFFSKYCRKKIITPSPKFEAKKFIEKIKKICREENIEVILPVRGPSTLAISKHKKELEKYSLVPFEDYEKLEKVYNKASLIQTASHIGILIPKTLIIKNNQNIENFLERLSFPVVIKLSKSEGSMGVKYAYNREDLIQKYFLLREKSDAPILLQEYISGEGYGCSVLFDSRSNPIAVFCHKRLRENPPTGGPSVARISIKWPELERITLKLMKHLRWKGLAMVEYKVDSGGKPYLMEVNPRFWGSLPLAIASGVDFPNLFVKYALGEKIEPIKDYQNGVIARRLIMGDLKVFLYYLKYSPNKIKFIKSYFNFFDKKVHDDILSLDDPMPAIGRLIWSLSAMLGKGGMD